MNEIDFVPSVYFKRKLLTQNLHSARNLINEFIFYLCTHFRANENKTKQNKNCLIAASFHLCII